MVAPTPVSLRGSPTLIYSTGPWTKDNLINAAEFIFQRNAYHPFVQCSHLHKHSDPVPFTEILQKSAGTATADRKMLHYCPYHVCAGLDTDNFGSNRKEVNSMDFLDKSNIFSYRTIGLWETIQNLLKRFGSSRAMLEEWQIAKPAAMTKYPPTSSRRLQKHFGRGHGS